jgi:hypothetical protein
MKVAVNFASGVASDPPIARHPLLSTVVAGFLSVPPPTFSN